MDANVSEHTDQKYEVYIIYLFGIQLPSVTHFDNHYIVTSCPGIIDECNSNGNCNKNNGVCECFDGYGDFGENSMNSQVLNHLHW